MLPLYFKTKIDWIRFPILMNPSLLEEGSLSEICISKGAPRVKDTMDSLGCGVNTPRRLNRAVMFLRLVPVLADALVTKSQAPPHSPRALVLSVHPRALVIAHMPWLPWLFCIWPFTCSLNSDTSHMPKSTCAYCAYLDFFKIKILAA